MKRIITYSLCILVTPLPDQVKSTGIELGKLDNTKPHHIQSGFGIDYGTVF